MERPSNQELPQLSNRPRLGRSGPRTKTGCLTCRKRKVRCDEGLPVCRRCDRLQVCCIYQSPRTNPSHRTSPDNQQPQPQSRHELQHSQQAQETNDLTCLQAIPLLTDGQSSNGGSFRSSAFTTVISANETNQCRDGQIDLSSQNMPLFDFQPMDASVLFSEFTEGLDSLFSEPSPLQSIPGSHDEGSRSCSIQLRENFANAPTAYGIRLQQHFMSLVSLPRLIQSVDCDWNDVRHVILSMAETSVSLSNAIYAFSDAHLSITEGREPIYAADYYDRASLGLEESMSENTDGEELKASFGAIFFLIYVELLIPIRSSFRPPHYHLRSTHALIRKHKSRLSSWRGTGRRIIMWLVLFDSKATYAGREGELLHDVDLMATNDGLDTSDETLQSCSYFDIIYRVLNKECFKFYLKIEQFTRRIIEIDKWHRQRGSLNDELEVLQIGKKIDADLDAHWASRPILMQKAIYPENLVSGIQEPLAKRLCETVRQYLVHFHAHRIYLHRVAFRKYPREDKVDQAMQMILTLAKVDADEGVLPSAFQWPLFMVGLEATAQDREWIESALSSMVKAKDLDHAGAEMTLQVLRVISRRQDAGDNVVDCIAVRNELFKGSLSVM